ncbi:MAG TPA: SAM-dependent chlorinase/fluorinase [Thermoanaerobaculia bacterium]|nr:SAM-dependent chlorinase/fluorinase [Thermoanaerobaculia bacterium]
MRIALLTDFGTRDPYVAAMKGVIASRCDAPVHDLTHEIAPHDVLEAAWFLKTVVAWWPRGTIFVCVVDPGVGTDRKIIALEQDEKLFLAPDNGLLTFILPQSPLPATRGEGQGEGHPHSIENESLFLPAASSTFHGRDRFAPVAAALANGLPLAEVGPPLEQLVTLPYTPPSYGEVVRGSIVAIDRFGNAITDIERARIPFDAFALHVRDIVIDRLERTYGGAAPGPFLITGSSGCIEISVANASAADRLHLRRLERVEVWAAESSGT